MFRKRIATAGLIAASTFSAGTFSTTSAQAEVMDLDDDDEVVDLDEGGGKVVDLDAEPTGPSPVAGEPTDAMKQAKDAFDKKSYAQAAQGLYEVVNGTSGDDAGNKQLAEFYLAQSLYFLKFYQSSFEGFTKIADNPSHLKFAETLMWLAKLATDMNEAADIISHVGKYKDDEIRRFDNANQKEL